MDVTQCINLLDEKNSKYMKMGGGRVGTQIV